MNSVSEGVRSRKQAAGKLSHFTSEVRTGRVRDRAERFKTGGGEILPNGEKVKINYVPADIIQLANIFMGIEKQEGKEKNKFYLK